MAVFPMNDNARAQTMAGGWDIVETTDGYMHNVPCLDYKPHGLLRLTCWCRPQALQDDDHIIVHNSMDRREFVTRLH